MATTIQFEAALTTVQVDGVSAHCLGGFSKTDVELPNGVTMKFSGSHHANDFKGLDGDIVRYYKRAYGGPVRFKITIEEID